MEYNRYYYEEYCKHKDVYELVIGLYNNDDMDMIQTKAEFTIIWVDEDFYKINLFEDSFVLLREFNDLFLSLADTETLSLQDLHRILKEHNFKGLYK